MVSKLKKFYNETKMEFNKVVWPTKNELMVTSGVVIVSVIFFSFLFLGVDYVAHFLIKLFLDIGKVR
jgi:preprotein translocase SecE subunit